MTQKRLDMARFKTLTARYLLFNVITISLLSVSLLSGLKITNSIRNDSKLIYMAGSLRFRAFEMALDSLRLNDAHNQLERKQLSNVLQKEMAEFEQILSIIRSGDMHADFGRLSNKDAVRQFQEVVRAWSSRIKPELQASLRSGRVSPVASGQGRYTRVDFFVYGIIDTFVKELERGTGEKEQYLRSLLNTLIMGAIVITILFYLYIRSRILRPVQLIEEAAHKMEGGNLFHRVSIQSRSELGRLAGAFNRMADALLKNFEELHQHNRELISLCDATNRLNTISSGENIYSNICETAYGLFDLRLAWIGLIQPGSIHIEPIASAGDDDGYLDNMEVSWGDSETGCGPAGKAIRTKLPCCMHVDDEEFAPWSNDARRRGFNSFLGLPLLVGNHCLGVLVLCSSESSYFDESRIKLCQIFANNAASVCENAQLIEYMILALARSSEVNDEATGSHVRRVGDFCALLATEMGLGDAFVGSIRVQSTLHDVGKIHVPSELLRKPGRLTNEEFEVVKRHSIYGADIIGYHPWLNMARNIAVFHHERWDGSGYPFGLRQNEIPIESRIVCIADQYDALRTMRPYKQALGHDAACRIILEGDGRTMPSHFDPEVLAAFSRVSHHFDQLYYKYEDDRPREYPAEDLIITPDMLMGIREIDEQHLQIIEFLKKLNANHTREGRDDDNVKAMDFVRDYIEQHFRLEEQYMGRYHYPLMHNHVYEHANFIQDYGNMKKKYYQNVFDSHSWNQIRNRLTNWFVEHLKYDDRTLADYLKTFMGNGKSCELDGQLTSDEICPQYDLTSSSDGYLGLPQ